MIVRRALFTHVLVPLYILAIPGIPTILTLDLYKFSVQSMSPAIALLLAAAAFGPSLVLVAGSIGRITARAIVPGKFPRDLAHPVYGPRHLYSLCWTSIYCFQPLYHAILAIPVFKWFTFRLFGYKGSLQFQTCSDTWIRDLPLLTLAAGVYLSNKATISPTMCLRDGTVLALPISIGERTMIGHLAMVAPGANIGSDCDIGVGASVGLKVTMGDRSTLGHCAQIDHQAVIGSNCHIGVRAYVGRAAVLHNGVRIPPGAVIPARSVLLTQADVAAVAINSNTPVPGGILFHGGAMADGLNA